MADAKKPVEKEQEEIKEEPEDAGVAEVLGKILKETLPKDVKATLAKLEEEFESPLVYSEDKVAVLGVSYTGAVFVDGWPGGVRIQRGNEFTKDGLAVVGVYSVGGN